ncbi:MAG: hypothetical protein QW651_08210 [Candidatus Nezhaarchaeales archaeon]
MGLNGEGGSYAVACRLCGKPSKQPVCDECYAKFTSIDKGVNRDS